MRNVLYTGFVQLNRKNTRKTGDLGESIAANYLAERGFTILERNYWKKFGEIDIVARAPADTLTRVSGGTTGKVHFIEVKAVSHGTIVDLQSSVLRGTWRPEELVHQFKLRQIHKVLEAWLIENDYEGDWQIDVLTVRMVPREKYAVCKYIENIT